MPEPADTARPIPDRAEGPLLFPEPQDHPSARPIQPSHASDLFEMRPAPARRIDPIPSAADRPKPRRTRTAKQRSYAIARLYTQRHPLIRHAAVAAIVLKAIQDGRFTDDQIKAAVDRLARGNWRVTEDTLRVELETSVGLGALPAKPVRRPTVSESSVVYLIGSRQARPVKIGTTIRTTKRLNDIQAMSPVPLEVLFEHPGEYDLETWLHARFRRYRLHGEWFDFGDLDPVETVRGGIGEYERRRKADETAFNIPSAERGTA